MTLKKLRSLGVKIAEQLKLYEERAEEYIKLVFQLIKPILVTSKQCVVLDLGCGSGWLTASLQRIAMAIGVDIKLSPSWGNREGCFVVADARALPIINDAIDIAIALSLLEHVDSWEQILHEVFRTLRPGGIFIIQLPNLKYLIEPHTKFPLLYLTPRAFKQAIARSTGYAGIEFNCTIENVLKKAREIGFEVRGILHYYHGKKHTIMKMLAKITPPHGFFLILQKPHPLFRGQHRT